MVKGLGIGVPEKRVSRFLDTHVSYVGGISNRMHWKGNVFTVTLAVSLVSDRMQM